MAADAQIKEIRMAITNYYNSTGANVSKEYLLQQTLRTQGCTFHSNNTLSHS